jgi:hypothetical protein
MANYLTNDTDLKSVADAIRTKGGTSAQLEFPQGFVDAIDAISGGGVLGVTQDEDGYLMLSPVSAGELYTKTSYTAASNTNFAAVVAAVNIPVAHQNEILIWNVRGANKQSSGSITGKWGFTITQNGGGVNNGRWYQRATSVVAPDNASPASSLTAGGAWVQDGHYYAGASAIFIIAGGNTVDFIQIPYNIGWATA